MGTWPPSPRPGKWRPSFTESSECRSSFSTFPISGTFWRGDSSGPSPNVVSASEDLLEILFWLQLNTFIFPDGIVRDVIGNRMVTETRRVPIILKWFQKKRSKWRFQSPSASFSWWPTFGVEVFGLLLLKIGPFSTPPTSASSGYLSLSLSFLHGSWVWIKWEWDASFWFSSLSTIGFGDLVPGTSVHATELRDAIQVPFIFCSVYLLLGMALIAMCFNLMQEEVIAKVRSCGRWLGCSS